MKFIRGCFGGSKTDATAVASLAAIGAASSPVAAAHAQAQLAFAFSGGGFMLPYYAGVCSRLISLGLLQPGVTHLSGSSAGSLVAASISCGIPPQELLDSFMVAAADCRENGVNKRLGAVLQAHLEKHLPADAHVRCSGIAHIGITELWPAPKHKLVSSFTSKDDLISALMASCHLPVISNGSIATRHGKKSVVDGGITNLIPIPAHAKGNGWHVVKIACLPRAHIPHLPLLNKKRALKHLAIAPDLFQPYPHPVEHTLKHALVPGPPSFLVSLVQAGERDVNSWVKAEEGLSSYLKTLPQPASAPAATLRVDHHLSGKEGLKAPPQPLTTPTFSTPGHSPSVTTPAVSSMLDQLSSSSEPETPVSPANGPEAVTEEQAAAALVTSLAHEDRESLSAEERKVKHILEEVTGPQQGSTVTSGEGSTRTAVTQAAGRTAEGGSMTVGVTA